MSAQAGSNLRWEKKSGKFSSRRKETEFRLEPENKSSPIIYEHMGWDSEMLWAWLSTRWLAYSVLYFLVETHFKRGNKQIQMWG